MTSESFDVNVICIYGTITTGKEEQNNKKIDDEAKGIMKMCGGNVCVCVCDPCENVA